MRSHTLPIRRLLLALATGVGAALAAYRVIAADPTPVVPLSAPTSSQFSPQFLVVAGGGAPSYNEIALENNVLYFRRTLTVLGLAETEADVFFANGDSGEATVRYLNVLGLERFRPPRIPHLTGAATYENVSQWFDQAVDVPACQRFFYFTGHGLYNRQNPDNNALILWEEDLMDVQDLATPLDALPPEQPFVTMMAQCFSGSFANLIYEGGDPSQPVALQSRCGFFATVASRPSVGCTPAVNEADYQDYSSSFFAGLSGIDRVGQPVASADYDQNGIISYSEAHAFAKVDEETSDWPISTLEAWLQRQATLQDVSRILAVPLADWAAVAEPQRRYVIEVLANRLGYDLAKAYTGQGRLSQENSVQEAYRVRLEMELMNVGMTQKIQTRGSEDQRRVLLQISQCETSSAGQG